MNNRFVFINDVLIPVEKACLPVNDLSIQRGYGIFDFFKTINNVPLFLDDHLNRFYTSAEQMHLPVRKSREDLKILLHHLMQKNRLPHSGIRLTLTGGYSPDGYTVSEPNLIITQQPLQLPSKELYEKGICLATYPHQRQLPHIKTIDYLMGIWLQPFLQRKGADDVLYHQNDIISECPRSNFFMVTPNDKIVTPLKNILKGVIRKKILELAGNQFETEERDVTLKEVQHAKEAFISSTTKHILPVVQVNDFMIGRGKPGAVTQWLSRELNGIVCKLSAVNSIT